MKTLRLIDHRTHLACRVVHAAGTLPCASCLEQRNTVTCRHLSVTGTSTYATFRRLSLRKRDVDSPLMQVETVLNQKKQNDVFKQKTLKKKSLSPQWILVICIFVRLQPGRNHHDLRRRHLDGDAEKTPESR